MKSTIEWYLASDLQAMLLHHSQSNPELKTSGTKKEMAARLVKLLQSSPPGLRQARSRYGPDIRGSAKCPEDKEVEKFQPSRSPARNRRNGSGGVEVGTWRKVIMEVRHGDQVMWQVETAENGVNGTLWLPKDDVVARSSLRFVPSAPRRILRSQLRDNGMHYLVEYEAGEQKGQRDWISGQKIHNMELQLWHRSLENLPPSYQSAPAQGQAPAPAAPAPAAPAPPAPAPAALTPTAAAAGSPFSAAGHLVPNLPEKEYKTMNFPYAVSGAHTTFDPIDAFNPREVWRAWKPRTRKLFHMKRNFPLNMYYRVDLSKVDPTKTGRMIHGLEGVREQELTEVAWEKVPDWELPPPHFWRLAGRRMYMELCCWFDWSPGAVADYMQLMNILRAYQHRFGFTNTRCIYQEIFRLRGQRQDGWRAPFGTLLREVRQARLHWFLSNNPDLEDYEKPTPKRRQTPRPSPEKKTGRQEASPRDDRERARPRRGEADPARARKRTRPGGSEGRSREVLEPICYSFRDTGKCSRGSNCPYRHSRR